MFAWWQEIVVGLCCLLAAAYILRLILRVGLGNRAGCGTGCGTCDRREDVAGANRSDGFVSVDELTQTSSRGSRG
jgi:hypothetical protein